MKIFKIFLLSISVLLSVTFFSKVIEDFSRIFSRPLYDSIMISLTITLSTLCAIYHVLSYGYYRKKKMQPKVSKLFWVGAACLSIFIFYVAGNEFVKLLWNGSLYAGRNREILIIMTLVFVYGVLNLIEIIQLQKRIKKLAKVSLEDEINDIGN